MVNPSNPTGHYFEVRRWTRHPLDAAWLVLEEGLRAMVRLAGADSDTPTVVLRSG